MTLERPMILIVDKLADESRRRRNSAVVWFAIGAGFQAGIILLLLKAQSFTDASAANKLGFFVFASFFAAWLPMLAAAYYFRGARKSAMLPGNFLFRALTSEPQLIKEIEREPENAPRIEKAAQPIAEKSVSSSGGGEVAGAIVGGVMEIALSAAFGASADDSSSNDYDNLNDTSSVSGRTARVFVRLNDGAKYEIRSPLDAAATVAALQKHAAHAALVETKK